MFGQIPVIAYAADEGGTLANDNEMLVNHNLNLESLTWVNTGATDVWIQIFNTPRKLDVVISAVNTFNGVITAPNHGYVTGDKITVSSIDDVGTGYLSVVGPNSFKVYDTRANALAGPETDADQFPTTGGDTGTFSLASDAASAPLSEEYPLLSSASGSNYGSFTNARFTRGLYVRAVTTQGGSTLAGDDIQFTPRYSSGPIMGGTYED